MKIVTQVFWLILIGPIAAQGADWPWFGGPNRDGVASEKEIVLDWGDREPARLWKAKIGAGYSSIVVGGGNAYAVGHASDKNMVRCFNAKTGALIWKFEYSCAKAAKYFEGGSRGTPALDDGILYSLSHEGTLFAFDAHTGRIKWAKHLLKDFNGRRPTWGFSGCPLVIGDRLIVETGSAKGSLVALDKKDGDLLWSSGSDEAGYSSPMLRTGNPGQGLIFNEGGLIGFRVSSGEILFKYGHETQHGINVAQPLDLGQHVLLTSAYGKGAALIDLTGASPSAKWTSDKLACQMSGGVRHGDHYYGIHGQAGGRSRQAPLKCVELMTGKVIWEQQGFGVGTVIRVGKTLVILSDQGELALVDADPGGYRERARFQVLGGKDMWTPPTYANGLLYCRNQEGDLICLRLGSL